MIRPFSFHRQYYMRVQNHHNSMFEFRWVKRGVCVLESHDADSGRWNCILCAGMNGNSARKVCQISLHFNGGWFKRSSERNGDFLCGNKKRCEQRQFVREYWWFYVVFHYIGDTYEARYDGVNCQKMYVDDELDVTYGGADDRYAYRQTLPDAKKI